MRRSPRAFRASVAELERRALLARLVPAPPPPLPANNPNSFPLGTDYVRFSTPGGSAVPSQVVGQQDGSAMVMLSRYSSWTINDHALQVRVTTDPSSPYVGVNVGAVDQVVTFAPGQLDAALAVPIIAGAANPGEVDVRLTMTPVNPSPSLGVDVQVPAETLRVLASDASLPPAIVATNGTPQGIQLVFNKPMDPVQASNVKNYFVLVTTLNGKSVGLFSIGFSPVRTPVALTGAVYDAATNTVTLIPRRPIHSFGMGLSVTQGAPSRPAGRANAGAVAAHGLLDVQGHLIQQDGGAPGKFNVTVPKGFSATT